MSRTQKFLFAALGVLAVLDAISAITASRVTGSNKAPAAAIVAIALFAALNLVAMYGVSRAARWARPLIYVTRALNIVSNVLGISSKNTAEQWTVGSLTFALSVAVIVVLISTRRQTLPAQSGNAKVTSASA